MDWQTVVIIMESLGYLMIGDGPDEDSCIQFRLPGDAPLVLMTDEGLVPWDVLIFSMRTQGKNLGLDFDLADKFAERAANVDFDGDE